MARDYARNRNSRRNARIAETTPRGGKRPSGQRRLNAYRQPRGPRTFTWLMFGILLGLLIAGGLYTKFCRPNQRSSTSANLIQETNSPTKAAHDKKRNKLAANSDEDKTEVTTFFSADDDPEIAEIAATDTDNDSDTGTAPHSATDHSKFTATKSHKKSGESADQHYDFYTMLPKNDLETIQSVNKEKSDTKNTSATHYQLQLASFTKFEEADHLKAQLILQGHNATIQKHQHEGIKHYRVTIGPFKNSKAASAEQQRLAKSNIKSLLMPM